MSNDPQPVPIFREVRLGRPKKNPWAEPPPERKKPISPKLSVSEADKIRKRYWEQGESIPWIAAFYGISRVTAWKVIRGISYRSGLPPGRLGKSRSLSRRETCLEMGPGGEVSGRCLSCGSLIRVVSKS